MAVLEQTQTTRDAHQDAGSTLTPHKREEIVRRYWMKGDLTPLAIANLLAGQKAPQPA